MCLYMFIYFYKDWHTKSLYLKVELIARHVEKCLDGYEKGSVHLNKHCWHLASVSWQYALSQCVVCEGVYDIQEHCSGSAATAFPMSVLMWLFCFLTIKNHPWGCHFEIISNIQRAVTDVLQDLTEEDFQQCLQGWKDCLQQCVASERIYCKDHVEL